MLRSTLLLTSALIATATQADSLAEKLEQLAPEQKALFTHLQQLSEDDDWATGLVSTPSGSGPAWAIIDKDPSRDQYRYRGCQGRGTETYAVKTVEVNTQGLGIVSYATAGQRLDRSTEQIQSIGKTEWLQRSKNKDPGELLYIAQHCDFQSGLQYWNNIEAGNSQQLETIKPSPLIRQDTIVNSLLNSSELFQFQPKLDSISAIVTTDQNDISLQLFEVQLSGNVRSGYCSSHSDRGYFIARFSRINQSDELDHSSSKQKNPEQSLWQYDGGKLLASNHCISSSRYHYLGHSDSDFTIQRSTDRAEGQAQKIDCLTIDNNLDIKTLGCPDL